LIQINATETGYVTEKAANKTICIGVFVPLIEIVEFSSVRQRALTMKLRRTLVLIFLTGLVSAALVHLGYAQATPKGAPSSNWEFGYGVKLLAAIAVALVIGALVLLFFAARKPNDSFIFKMRPNFFFLLAMTYTMVLLLVAVGYNLSYTGPQPWLLGNMLPIAVPWFGALGAVAISLEGTMQWSESRWNPEYNYWHVGRPVFGAVLGTIGFFMFVLIVSSSGNTPKFLETSDQITPAKDFIVYYVVAFLAGYREETFRELIQRVTDMILKPSERGAGIAQVNFKVAGVVQSEIAFPVTPVGETPMKTIDIVSSGDRPLGTATLTLSGSDTKSKEVFSLTNDNVTGKDLGPNQAGTIDIKFAPKNQGTYSAILSVAAANLKQPATIRITGSA
jgi:hypothetical protein